MNTLLAVVLVCAATMVPDACTRETALDVVVAPVPTPFACLMASQQTIARDSLVADGRFAVVRCEHRKG